MKKFLLFIFFALLIPISIYAIPTWFCFYRFSTNEIIILEKDMSSSTPHVLVTEQILQLIKLQRECGDQIVQRGYHIDKTNLDANINKIQTTMGKGKVIEWDGNTQFTDWYTKLPIQSKPPVQQLGVIQKYQVLFINQTRNISYVTEVNTDPAQLPAIQTQLLNELIAKNGTDEIVEGGTFDNQIDCDRNISLLAKANGNNSIYEWNKTNGMFSYWYEKHPMGNSSKSKSIQTDQYDPEADLLEDMDNPNRSKLTPGAYEKEVGLVGEASEAKVFGKMRRGWKLKGNRWMLRFSSKRPSYNTFADWLMEAQLRIAEGGDGCIDIHPEDYERLLKTPQGEVEAYKIWEYNARWRKGGKLSKWEYKKIRGRGLNEYTIGVIDFNGEAFMLDVSVRKLTLMK